MGNRDALLAGAKRCIVEKGYAHTTARDIVAASGANLASIGYHFGSKDALLDAAILDSFDDWDADVDAALEEHHDGPSADRLAAFLDVVVERVQTQRPLAAASLQWVGQVEFSDLIRGQLAEAYARGRREFASMLLQVEEDEVDDESARTVGSLGLALVNGLVLQWLIDPGRAPSGADMAAALRAVVLPPNASSCGE